MRERRIKDVRKTAIMLFIGKGDLGLCQELLDLDLEDCIEVFSARVYARPKFILARHVVFEHCT